LDDFLQVDDGKSGLGGWNDLDLAHRQPLCGFFTLDLPRERRNLLRTLGLRQQDNVRFGRDHGCEVNHAKAGE